MNTEVKPWAPTELTPDTKKKSLVDDLVDLLRVCWEENTDNFQGMAVSTSKEDAATGSVTIDKHILAYLVKKAAPPGSRVDKVDVSEINRVISFAARRVGIDRKAIAARKAEYLAIQGAEPLVEQAEPSMNERRDEVNGSADPTIQPE